MTPPPFSTIILGGTGQVGGAAVDELLAIPECREVIMVTRKAVSPRERVRNVVLDTGAADFVARIKTLASEMIAKHNHVSAVSCVGIGKGTAQWSEDDLKRVEVGVVGAFARGCRDGGIANFCLLSAVGSTATSPFKYVRVMGMKEDAVRAVGFTRLAIFRPGIIIGNVHTPGWSALLGAFLPGGFGNIDQQILGRAIAKEAAGQTVLGGRATGETIYENADMRKLAAE
ncbi:MAG: hypothetical protein J0I29_16095 [Rhizobiales bacterium]|nr:hypothetical protein [Hyphomicrobiales bacterium]